MEAPKPAVRPLPASAQFVISLGQKEYSAALAAIAYFANRLRDPKEREIASSALQQMNSPIGITSPSVESEKPIEEEKDDKGSS